MSKQTYVIAPENRIGVVGKICYSIGFAGKDGFTTIANSYSMLFLMMVAGLDGAFIGVMMLVCRVWDAFFDPVLGSLADHTNTRFGRFRPYLFSVIPMAIVFIALFSNPSLGSTGKLVYYCVFYWLYSMLFTVVEIPYFGLAGAMSFDPQERASVTAWSRIISRIPAFALPLLLGALVTRYDGAGLSIGQNGAQYTAIIIGIIAVIAAFVSFAGCKEKALVNAEPSVQKASGWKDFWNVLKGNRALLIVMLAQLFFTFNTILSDMINSYYLTYYLGSPAIITGVGVALVAVGACIGQFLYPYILSGLKSCKTIMMIGAPIYCALLAVCYVAGTVSAELYLVFLVILNLFTGILQINVINLCFEVCDMLEYKNGVRADATVFAVVSFLMKLAAGLASTIAGFGLQLVGFAGMGPVMIEVTQTMSEGVAVLRFAMPAILALLSFLAVCLYPITKSQITSVREELAVRHGKQEG
ncbi:MAG: sugar (Glycoside-Pentoside-Hexuronide) transporter [Oscillospiraceae bacterium]|nr:sugar (Glycoside-Pentoside-Hexuronide) transporter [Oscillospiraceae bacterium]